MVREVSFVICLFYLVGKVFKIETFLVVILAFSLRLCYTCWLYNKILIFGLQWSCTVFLGSWEKGRAFYVVLWFSPSLERNNHIYTQQILTQICDVVGQLAAISTGEILHCVLARCSEDVGVDGSCGGTKETSVKEWNMNSWSKCGIQTSSACFSLF